MSRRPDTALAQPLRLVVTMIIELAEPLDSLSHRSFEAKTERRGSTSAR